ncbi:alpha-amylase family glycosyl hydrolase [Oceaniglobus roseus]|uniref:alpha-amylase family glycosyl hydrolase n=1 Tax=Oceaniglobus roseus TaxID=1737570 RepID=UPI000C7EC7F7|nr:alpha-amylase family glycosyl hydrolase [Kandeliimicrobium roseum]
MKQTDQTPWWQDGIIYQIYPRSFQDSDGDGVGDLNGIARRLDHLVDLGVDAVWISPIYPSPGKDAGYDVSDYCGIDPLFGTLADFDALVAAAHGRGLKVLMDFVPSHSSDRHPWFLESRSSRDNPKRDWYVWRDARPDGSPPNNWISEFAGPAWTWDEATGQYWLNIYLPEQPALNWRNPDVRQAMYDAMRFWFDRGVDGFRVDAAEHLAPDDRLRDNLPNPDWTEDMGPARSLFRTFSSHQPAGFDAVHEMRAVADEYEDRVLVGEAYGTLDEVVQYYGRDLKGFHLPFNFELINAPWDARHIAGYIDTYEAAIPKGGWPNWVLGNHDRKRIASRVGQAQARVAAMLLLTLRGTPTLYQGDELGLENGHVPPEMVQDPWEKNVPGFGLGRDPVRMPIPWDDTEGRGFTTGTPWLPVADGPSVIDQRGAETTMLTLTQRMIALRRAEITLRRGEYRRLHGDDHVLVFARDREDARLVVALNFTDRDQLVALEGTPLLSTVPGELPETAPGSLRANEGLVLRVR